MKVLGSNLYPWLVQAVQGTHSGQSEVETWRQSSLYSVVGFACWGPLAASELTLRHRFLGALF